MLRRSCSTIKILGISSSLRNARFSVGSDRLVREILDLQTESDLRDFIKEQTKILNTDFFEAGRKQQLSFDQIYANFRKHRKDRGLSNSEASLVAALWGASQCGADIMHCSLSEFIDNEGNVKHKEDLRSLIASVDAILLSGPVYFGDRGSLSHDFMKFLQMDPDCKAHIKGKCFAGVSVGAKRNGGQETTLVYQLLDMVNAGMLGVGNDSQTTSQYGGTSVAGDVGTLWEDDYGINTCIGTGRRLATVTNLLGKNKGAQLKGKVKISIWMVQDNQSKKGLDVVRELVSAIDHPQVEFDILDFTQETVQRCIACDICPTHVGPPEEYRCIIKHKSDLFVNLHNKLIDTDAILITAYSTKDRQNMTDVYQRFMERTRYLRRGDYVFSNKLVAPFVISQLGARENLHMRMLTSMLRHHTVMSHPLLATEYHGEILDKDRVVEIGKQFIEHALQLASGVIDQDIAERANIAYQPIGYQISAMKAQEASTQSQMQEAIENKKHKFEKEKQRRLQNPDNN